MPHQPRPRIGINTDFYAATKAAPAHAKVNAGYFDAVLAAGGLPILLPPLNREAELNTYLDLVDGVVLCGGMDIDARRIGQQPHSATKPMATRRDESDRILVRLIVERQMPVLGIGVGMQQLNVRLGGSLMLHLPEDMPRAMPHFDPTGGPHRHAVTLEPGTRFEEIYGDGEIRVNSHHHQAVRQLGTGLRVAARAPDGVIEAYETTDPSWYCVGVQWHPESDTASALDMQLWESFLIACGGEARTLSVAA